MTEDFLKDCGMTREDLDKFHDDLRKRWEPFDYFGPEFVEALKNQPTRLFEHPAEPRPDGTPGWPVWKSKQVLHNGRWYHLCRTDLMDNVTTWGCIEFFPEPSDTAKISLTHSYGARVTEDTIFIIDSYTDG